MTGYKLIRRRSTILLTLCAAIVCLEVLAVTQHSRPLLYGALALAGCLAIVGVVFGLQTVRALTDRSD